MSGAPASARRIHALRSWLLPLITLCACGALVGISTNLAKVASQAGLPPLAYVAWSLTGAAVLSAHKIAAPDANAPWVLLALTAPVLLAIGNIYRTARWPQGVSPEALTPGMLVTAAIMLLSAGLFEQQLPNVLSLRVPTGEVFPLALIALQAAIFAAQNLLLFVLQRSGGPVLLSLLGSVGAIVGVPVAVLVLGEAVPSGLAIGATLIGAGIALVTVGGIRSRKRSNGE